MNAIATGTGLNNAALMYLPNARPSTAAGINAIARLTDELLRLAVVRKPRDEPGELDAILPHDRQHRAGLNHDLENLAPLVVESEQLADDDQMPGARYRQELGEPLDRAEYHHLDP